jgi:Protein of unknown function (DUF763)
MEPAKRHQHDKLLPDRDRDIPAQHSLEPGCLTNVTEVLTALADPAVELAEGHPLIGAGLADHAGRDDGAGDECCAAHHRLIPEDKDHSLGSVDTVLQRDDRGLRPDYWTDLLSGRLDVPQFDAQQNDIDRADAGDVVGGVSRPDMGLAAITLDTQPVFVDCRQMGAARDEDRVRPGFGERGAIGPADASGVYGTLAAATDRGPVDFSDLLLIPGVGARTVRALAMVAEVVHGTPYRFADPARFSFAYGGKDGHPFPVPLRVYDETIRVLKTAVQSAKLGREEALGALERLDGQARLLEHHASGLSVEAVIARKRERSYSYGGRSVFGWGQPPPAQPDAATTKR